MLNKQALLSQFGTLSGKLFADYSEQYELAARTWRELSTDPGFASSLNREKSQWLLPSWQDSLSAVTSYKATESPYSIVSTDGSQIYPDRHMGTLCSLVNVGIVEILYGQPSAIALDAIPRVELIDEHELFSGVEYINARRQELEWSYALDRCTTRQAQGQQPLYLCDGSLILWHLETANDEIREEFLARYLSLMHKFYHEHIPTVGYISLPKSKELVNLVRTRLADADQMNPDAADAVSQVLDTHVAGSFLAPGERTILFKSHAPIVEHYAPHIKPHFFYLHVGTEVARVEVPAWVAEHSLLIDHITSVLLDQAAKGTGYPVVIAEAHEQAVIKGPDREFFYQQLSLLANKERVNMSLSRKQRQKYRMNV